METQNIREARRLRDEAIEAVLLGDEEWSVAALAAAKVFILEAIIPFTSEDMRIHLCLDGLLPPEHHNAWGGLTMGLKSNGLIHEIGMAQMRLPKSHARRTPLYWKEKDTQL